MDSKSAEHAAQSRPISTGRFSEAVNKHSEEIHELRWIMLNLLWHSFPSTTPAGLAEERMLRAGATREEVRKLT